MDRQGEEVDHFLGMQAQQVRPQDAVSLLLNERLEPLYWLLSTSVLKRGKRSEDNSVITATFVSC